MTRENKYAFTLIELLIVVAIIAILAAIAIPNLLEAQTRAKVSRVKADIRSLAVAVESYHVDHNRYLPHKDTSADTVPLTTPVSYMTSLPRDPFESEKNPVYWLVGDYYTWQDLRDIFFRTGYTTWGGGDWLARQISMGRHWSLSSPGPDLVETMHYDAIAQYDPTNGSISTGDIYRLGP